MKRVKLTHIQVIALGYFIMILTGTLLLMLPIAVRDGGSASPMTALFTATSASCVTGLVLKDTATYWSGFGQAVIITLIQIGGLGFMTIATFFYRLVIKKHGLRERVIMAESINTGRLSGFSPLIKRIVFGTAIFEGVGAALLATRFIPIYGVAKGIYYSVFHSVSAFCNAGFDLFGEQAPFSSLTIFYDDITVNVVIMALILIGGTGFLVWDDIAICKGKFKRYSLQTKLVLTSNVFLVFVGAVLFFIFEQDYTGAGLGVKSKILTSLFASVTPRTAGFNTVDLGAMSNPSKLLTVILMFIGGNSGSTAGGVKTTTVLVILCFAVASVRGRADIHIFGRKIGLDVFKKAVLIVTINLTLALCGVLVISALHPFSLADIMLEVFSAIGTVGISTGLTREVGTVAHIILVFLMYCGRVGSISFAAALFEMKIKPPVSYPEESVTVG